jgi:hypothetical protein
MKKGGALLRFILGSCVDAITVRSGRCLSWLVPVVRDPDC